MLTILQTPWSCKSGEILKRTLRFKNAGTPEDISTWEIDCDLRTDEDNDVAVSASIVKRTPNSDGIADLSIATEDLPVRSYHFDIRVKIGSETKYYLEGVLEILPSYTRD